MEESDGDFKWMDNDNDGWGVTLTDKESTDPVTTTLCSSINGKPIVSMTRMFYNSQASSIDLSSYDTSNVVNMGDIFSYSIAQSLDLSSFDTSNVTTMRGMFTNCTNLNTIYVGNKWNINSVVDSSDMFYKCTSLPLYDSTKIDASMANTNGDI